MTPFAFDTLSASKRLREAGMAEGVAEAVVAVFQHPTASVDFSQLATKADIADMVTKADIADMATKAEVAALRSEMATKTDLHALRADVSEKLRQQTLGMLGGMAALLGLFTLIGKVIS